MGIPEFVKRVSGNPEDTTTTRSARKHVATRLVAALVTVATWVVPGSAALAQSPTTQLLLIDDDTIDSLQATSLGPPCGVGPAGEPGDPARCLNDDIANPGERTFLFSRPVDATPISNLVLSTGKVGDEGLFRFSNPDPQVSLQNDATFTTQEFITATGMAADENNLDKIAGVVPLGRADIMALAGQTVCAVVYDSDIAVTGSDPASASLKGATLGVTAFRVTAVTPHPRGRSHLPQLTVQVLPLAEAAQVCQGV